MPGTLTPTKLLAQLEDGRVIRGETNIDAFRSVDRAGIKKVWLEPRVSLNHKAEKAILDADCVILSPGDFYTSLIPNLIVDGIKAALKKTKATILYFVNITTKCGETTGFKASDFLKTIEKYLVHSTIDYVIINKTKPSFMRLKPYIEQKAEIVEADLENFGTKPILIVSDMLKSNGLIRHDPEKIAKVVQTLI